MAKEVKDKKESLEELMMITLAMVGAVVKLLIAKGIITDQEFTAQLSAERSDVLAILEKLIGYHFHAR